MHTTVLKDKLDRVNLPKQHKDYQTVSSTE